MLIFVALNIHSLSLNTLSIFVFSISNIKSNKTKCLNKTISLCCLFPALPVEILNFPNHCV